MKQGKIPKWLRAPEETTEAQNNGRDANGQFTKDSTEGVNTRFKIGNTAALVWTEETILEKLEKMWLTLVQDQNKNIPENILTANDIKTMCEVCLMNGVSRQTLWNWEQQYKKGTAVFDKLKDIKWILETRVVYSGTVMDIFLLKNWYDMKDRTETDLKNDGGKFEAPQSLNVSAITTEVLQVIANARLNNEQ